MKNLFSKQILRMVLVLTGLYIFVPLLSYGMFFQMDGLPEPADMPFVLFIPYILGVVCHWYKKFELEGMSMNFLTYIKTNGFGTLMSLVLGVGGLTALWNTGTHSGLFPVTVTSWVTVFMFALAADTINSGMTSQKLNQLPKV